MDPERELSIGNASQKGKLLSDRFDNVSREMSSVARWLDMWVADPKESIGHIFDIGNSYDQSAESLAIHELVFGAEPVIDVHDFSEACLEWLDSGTHYSYQYEKLFQVLEQGNDFLLTDVFKWYLDNLDNLKTIFKYPESGYNRFMEKLEFLATGKTIREYTDWWREQVRKAESDRGEIE